MIDAIVNAQFVNEQFVDLMPPLSEAGSLLTSAPAE
jgi:hypothetical protein